MGRLVVAVDIDDVLLESGAAIIADYNRRFGTRLLPGDYYGQHDLSAWGNVDPTTAIQRVEEYVQSVTFINREPMRSVADSLRHLAERYELHAVTGRGDLVRDATNVWLEQYFPAVFVSANFSNMYDAQKRRSKGEICVEMGASFLIDDHIPHAKSAADHGLKVVLYGDYPWNQTDELPQGVVRAKDWPAVLEYFDGIG